MLFTDRDLATNSTVSQESNRLSNNRDIDEGIDYNILSSPMKVRIKRNEICIPASSMLESSHHEFNELSDKLSALLDQLSEIYTEIGYSRNDIEKNESSLFEAVSSTFDKFLQDSITYKQALKDENKRSIEVLKSLLIVIHDPNGTKTIPDLYLRNLMLRSNCEGATLLALRKSLESAKSYILKEYKDRLTKFVQQAETLQNMAAQVNNYDESMIANIPNPHQISSLMKELNRFTDPIELYPFILQQQKVLIHNETFNDLSDHKFTMIAQSIHQLQEEIHKRKIKLKKLSQDILSIWEELDIDYESDYNMVYEHVISYKDDNNSNTDTSDTMIRELESLFKDLIELKDERVELKSELEVKCQALWEKLKEAPESIARFKAANFDLSLNAIENYNSKYNELLELKRQHLKDFVLELRKKIQELWDSLYYSDEERSKFIPFFSKSYTDEVLTQHEKEAENLQRKYDAIKPLMELVHSFKDLMMEKADLEERTKDSSRLLQRNSHKVLMEEEKMRKRLARRLPMVIIELKSKIDGLNSDGVNAVSFLDDQFMRQLEEQLKILESKGRRIVSSGASSSLASSSSKQSSRVTSAQASRQPSRQPSRVSSRVTSRATSPTKPSVNPISSTVSSRIPTNGIQKPTNSFKRLTPRTAGVPALSATISDIPYSKSPQKGTTFFVSSKDQRKALLRTPSRLTRSQSTFQPQLSNLPENTTDLGSPKQKKSLLKPSNIPNVRPIATNSEKIVTSPLNSLINPHFSSGDKENQTAEPLMSSDNEEIEGDANTTYSNWRKEQLKKLNHAKSVKWTLDSF